MSPHVFFVFIFLRVQIFFANCLSEDDFNKANSNTSVQPDSLHSTKPIFNLTCPSNRCLRKCCKANEIYKWLNMTCVPDNDEKLQEANWSAQFHEFEVVYDSRCSRTTILLNNSLPDEDYYLYSNGSIYGLDLLIDFNQYCMDYLAEDNTIRPVVCYEETYGSTYDKEKVDPVFVLYSTGLAISDLFLIITLGLYLATPRLRKKVHDKCFLCHLFTLIIGFSSLIAIQNMKVEDPPCAFLSYMVQFWLLASFFWLNIMSIDMWRTVGNMQTLKESNVKKMVIYCVYAWGCPSLILTFSLLADNFLPSDHFLRTGFGENTCWFRDNNGTYSWLDPRYIHFYGFVSLTLLINIYTFVDTALMIKFQNNRWKPNNNADSKRHQSQKTRFVLFLKLFIVMGLYWMMEVISYHFDDESTFWIIVDFISTLQGVFIFVIFICNQRALMILNKRFFPRRAFLKQHTATFSGRNRSTCSKTSKASITEDVSVTSISSAMSPRIIPAHSHKLKNLSNQSPVLL